MSHPLAKIRRMFELVEVLGTITFSEVPDEAFRAVGMRNYWDGYFAGRAAPLGLAPAEVVHAVFYNFAEGEVARHIPWVWGKITPEEAIAVRERGSAAAIRQRIGELADAPGLVRIADLATRAALSAPTEGRALYAGLRTLDVPEEPVARVWHAATLLREHRGDGHNALLVAHGIGGTEAHVLTALALGTKPAEFGRIHHLPKDRLAAVVDGLRGRGLVDAADGFTDAGREFRERLETRTDELAAPAYDVLTAAELDELITGLTPVADAL
ncbi:MarR family transcriptional regulator [Amycolatopsis sp. NPDC088138]|uniref:SCO6745 family protein n=1 Tax=Amycolatopsis sp. NPDC088138 TaxID=3363938 RepID=UPI00381710F7